MRLESRKYLYDIQEAAGLAAQFAAGKDFAQYERDPMVRIAVERAFSIIGEALIHLARVDQELAHQISDYRNIVAFRNILVHAYAQVDDRIVWDILQTKVPVLIREVASLMQSAESEP